MKCNKCGFTYEGNFCSNCGAPASKQSGPDLDTSETAYGEIQFKPKRCKKCGEQVSRKEKQCPYCGARIKKAPVLLIVVFAIIFIGFIGKLGSGEENAPDHNRSSNNNQKENPPESVQVVSRPKREPSQDDILKNDVLSYLQENGEKDPTVIITPRRIEIRLFSDYTESSQPEDWENVIEHNIAIYNSLKDEVSGINERSISISLYGIEDSILLTTINGKYTKDTYNPFDYGENFELSSSIKMEADLLYEYGEYMEGKSVATVVIPKNILSGEFEAYTDNNMGIFPSIKCKFENEEITKAFNEGVPLTIVGYVAKKEGFGSTVSLINCSVVGSGELEEELKNGREAQIEAGEQFKEEFENELDVASASDKQSYIDSCLTVSYSDIERNPDSYKGTKVQINGTVDQVIEGWFDSVTLIVDCGGNKWYVTYTRDEGERRILEGDYITAYGECKGVRSYLTVLGAQTTVPEMKMVYYY